MRLSSLPHCDWMDYTPISCCHPFTKNAWEFSVLVGYKGNHISEHMCVGARVYVYGKGYGFEHLCIFPVCDRINDPNKM